MKAFFTGLYASIAQKVSSVIFAKRIAEEEEARKKKVIITAVCASIATVIVIGVLVALVVANKKKIKLWLTTTVARIKNNLPCKKKECECDDISVEIID